MNSVGQTHKHISPICHCWPVIMSESQCSKHSPCEICCQFLAFPSIFFMVQMYAKTMETHIKRERERENIINTMNFISVNDIDASHRQCSLLHCNWNIEMHVWCENSFKLPEIFCQRKKDSVFYSNKMICLIFYFLTVFCIE